MERRTFLKNAALGAGSLLATPFHPPFNSEMLLSDEMANHKKPLHKLKKPLAIAMWDFSWLLRHHRYGEFESWDKVLHQLAERGYNALRLDVMPQYVAADTNGVITEEFRSVKKDWVPSKWGNDYTMSFRPREALLEFLPLCKKYGFRVALSSWFINHNTGPRGIFTEKDGLLRAWTETILFLEKHHLFQDILYIDLLNEFPRYHGYDWVKQQIQARGDMQQFKADNPGAFVPEHLDMGRVGGYNLLQQKFYQHFTNDLISRLKARFPGQYWQMSITYTTPLDTIDLSEFGTLDAHLWFTGAADIPNWRQLGGGDQSKDHRAAFAELLQFWKEKKPEMVEWMNNAIAAVATTTKKYNITCGNTEGWGPVGWLDLPELNWQWVKEAADLAVPLAKKHENYKYLCSSNFTHPQFKGIWEDVKWHKRITATIKS